MQIDLEILDEVSRDFITYIAEHRPDWLDHAKSKLDESWNTHFVEIEFPDPAPVEGHEPLWISTYGGEVTVGLDAHHTHFPWPTDYNEEDGRPAAMEHIRALMDEELLSFLSGMATGYGAAHQSGLKTYSCMRNR